MIAIGVGKLVDNKELKEIAMGNNGNVLQVENFDVLVSKITDIVKISCAQRKLQ